jgi:hypothetical protein
MFSINNKYKEIFVQARKIPLISCTNKSRKKCTVK